MTVRMQGLLLRFLETGEVQKVGSDRIDTRVNVRVIASTNRSLSDMVAQGQFREDLFYRLNVIHLSVPPLRARREDIPQLVDYFLKRFTARRLNQANANGNGNGSGFSQNGNGHANGNGNGTNGNHSPTGDARALTIPPEVLSVLSEHHWPGNIRELENVVERLVVTARSNVVPVEDLPPEVRAQRQGATHPIKERRRTIAGDLTGAS